MCFLPNQLINLNVMNLKLKSILSTHPNTKHCWFSSSSLTFRLGKSFTAPQSGWNISPKSTTRRRVASIQIQQRSKIYRDTPLEPRFKTRKHCCPTPTHYPQSWHCEGTCYIQRQGDNWLTELKVSQQLSAFVSLHKVMVWREIAGLFKCVVTFITD